MASVARGDKNGVQVEEHDHGSKGEVLLGRSVVVWPPNIGY
jgi:hypothetical protein